MGSIAFVVFLIVTTLWPLHPKTEPFKDKHEEAETATTAEDDKKVGNVNFGENITGTSLYNSAAL